MQLLPHNPLVFHRVLTQGKSPKKVNLLFKKRPGDFAMKAVISSLIIIFACCGAIAQDGILQVIPAANKVGTEDAFEVKYVVKNANRAREYALTDMKDVQILGGPSRFKSITIMNGERSENLEITYVFKARHKGTITLPGIVISMDGREFKSNLVKISVVEGTVRSKQNRRQDPFEDPFFDQNPFGGDPFAMMQRQQQMMMQMMQRGGMMAPMPSTQRRQASASQAQPEITRANLSSNLFIRVDVDKTHAVVGEQVTASYKLYTRVPMEINLTRLPTLVGFWSQDFKLPRIPKPTREILNGKEYQVFEIKRTALFPTQTGVLELDPAEATGIARILKARRSGQSHPFEDDAFFGSMMMSDPDFAEQFMTTYDYEDVKVSLKSTPLKISVDALPADNRPASFSGAIGDYHIESKIDRTDLSTDDVANITFKVSGSGNLKMIDPPQIRFPNEINAFDVQQKDTITVTNDVIAGYKTFTYAFAPLQAGSYTIPATDFSFYDPETKQYKTLSTPSYSLNVRPGKNENEPVVNRLPKDIHDIQTAKCKLEKTKAIDLPEHPVYWGSFALPVLAYIGLLAYKRKEDKLQENQVLFKSRKANKVALKRLETAEKYLKLSAQNSFYEETSKAVWLYLSDKLNIPLSHLSKEVAAQKLSERNISTALKEELFRVTHDCEMALYAPDTGSMRMHQTYSDAYKLIGKLEDGLA